jgi:hypothetical protein
MSEHSPTIIFDVITKGVFISFREKTVMLPGPYKDQRAAHMDAEAYCRTRGWNAASGAAGKD